MARVFTAPDELTRQNGSRMVMVLRVQHLTGERLYSDRVISIGSKTTEARVVEWGTLDQQLEPERVGGFASGRIKLQDADGELRALFAISPGIQATVCEISILFWVPAFTGPPVLQNWSDRTILERGTFSAPSFDLKTNIWDCEFRNLSSLYDRSIGFRLDQNSFADLRCSSEEGKIIPVPFGNPVFRGHTVMIERPGEDAIGEATLEIHDTTFNLINDGDATAFDTGGSEKTYYIGYQYNYEEVKGRFDDVTNDPKTITITNRGSILAAGNSSGKFTASGFAYFTIDKNDLEDPTISQIGNPYWIFTDNDDGLGERWIGLVVTQWEFEGDVVVISHLANIPATIGTPWKLGRWPNFSPRWPPGTPVYEEGDWVYAISHLPIEKIEKIEARARIQSPGGGEPSPQWYSMETDKFTENLDDRSYNSQLGRESGDPGIATITVEQPPTTFGFEDNRLFATVRGIMHNGSSAASTASEIVKTIANSKWLGDFDSEHVDVAGLNGSDASIHVAFVLTEERKLAGLLGEIAFNGGCGVFWDQGTIQCKPWPEQGTGSGFIVNPENSIGYPVQEGLNLEDIFTEALAVFRPYTDAEEYRYLRKSAAAQTAIGRRVKEFEFKMLQRPTAVAAALNQWFAWYLNTQVRVEVSDIMPEFLETQLLDSASVVWEQAGVVSMDVPGIVVKSGMTFPDAKAGKALRGKTAILGNLWPFTIDEVDLPDDDECDPSPSDIPKIDPGWGQPVTQGSIPSGSGTLET